MTMTFAQFVYVCVSILLAGVVGIGTSFINSYFASRNKNLADKEVLKEVTKIAEDVKHITGRKNLMFQESKNGIVEFYTSMEALINLLLKNKLEISKSSDLTDIQNFQNEINALNDKCYYEKCKLTIIISDDELINGAEDYFEIVHELFGELRMSAFVLLQQYKVQEFISNVEARKPGLKLSDSDREAIQIAEYNIRAERAKVENVMIEFKKSFSEERMKFIRQARTFLNSEN
jgi:hypothetical protein